jgi:MGT family glycosyltransferase
MSSTTAEVDRSRALYLTGQRADLLFALFQGGGNLALILPIVEAAVARGHTVRVLAGPGVWPSRMPLSECFRERIACAGATYVPFAEPEVHPLDILPRARGVLRGWTPGALTRATWYLPPYRWTGAWATAVTAELRRRRVSMLVADFLLPGALVAAEALDVPAAALVHGIYRHRTAPGIPPYGTGLLSAHGPLGTLRDTLWAVGIQHVCTLDALPELNQVRIGLGLEPSSCLGDQFDRAARVLVLTDRAFDFDVGTLPANVRYVGMPINDTGSGSWTSPWSNEDRRPLLVVSLSTLPQGQGPVLQRILLALNSLPVRALVTLGPALDAGRFRAPDNVVIVPFAPHSAVLPHAAALITQCGIGGVIKALRASVPMVCIPLVGDQPDNAARVVARGAGVRLGEAAFPEQIRDAIHQVLMDQRFRDNARRLASTMTWSNGAERAVTELEGVARRNPV